MAKCLNPPNIHNVHKTLNLYIPYTLMYLSTSRKKMAARQFSVVECVSSQIRPGFKLPELNIIICYNNLTSKLIRPPEVLKICVPSNIEVLKTFISSLVAWQFISYTKLKLIQFYMAMNYPFIEMILICFIKTISQPYWLNCRIIFEDIVNLGWAILTVFPHCI